MSEQLRLAEYFVDHHATAALRAIHQLPAETAADLIEAIDDPLSLSTLKSMLPSLAARCIECLPRASAAAYLNQLSARDAAAILRYVLEPARKELLEQLNRRHSLRVSILLRYPRSLVGAWMDAITVCVQTTTQISVAQKMVVAEGYIYRDINVVSDDNRVIGAVSSMELLKRDQSDEPVATIMHAAAKPLFASFTLKNAVEWNEWSKHDTLPVIDREHKLIGIVRFVDLWSALTESHGSEESLPPSSASSNVLGVVETYCLGLADLMAALLSDRQSAT